MGGKESKPINNLTYEEALKRVNESELSRIKAAYLRAATLNGALNKQAFAREVLGDVVNNHLTEQIFAACGGSAKGILFKELFCSLVLLTRGNKEEKCKFIFGVYSTDIGTYITKSEMLQQLKTSEEKFNSESVLQLFFHSDKVTYEEFKDWLYEHPNATMITQWLLEANSFVSLSNDLEMPTFYQTLAGVTHLEEAEILELEKRYWTLKGSSPTGKLDTETLVPMMSPPLSSLLAIGVFNAFDENRDNHIDFKEMACGISAACRGPHTERQKFCFKVFDRDRDGKLNREELTFMVQSLLQIKVEANDESDDDVCCGVPPEEVRSVISKLLRDHDPSRSGSVTQEEFLIWCLNNDLTATFLNAIFEVCHIVLGLKPGSPNEEGEIVMGWLRRAERKSLTIGQFWYIVNMDWWNKWMSYVAFTPNGMDALSLCGGSPIPDSGVAQRKTRFQKANIESCLAMDNSGVTVTSIATLPSIEDTPRLTHICELNDVVSSKPNNTQKITSASSGSFRKKPLSNPSSLAVTYVDSRSNSPSHSPFVNRQTNSSDNACTPSQSRPSAIDNSLLIETNMSKIPQLTNEGGRLKKTIPLMQGRDFILVPESLWKVLIQWYGGSPSLPRQVIHGNLSGEIEIELYPYTLKILRHIPITGRSNPSYLASNWVGFGSYGVAMSKIADSTQYYMSTFPSALVFPKRTLSYLVTFSRLATLKNLYDFLSTKLKLRIEDIRLWHLRSEPAGMTLLEDDKLTLEDAGLEDLSQVLLEVRNKDLTWPEEMSQISRSSPLVMKSASKNVAGEKGMTGLNNLGNTCFLNAALQCCSNTIPLTTYFMRNMHLYELNPNNPCSMKGHMARQYGALINDIWNSDAKTVAPLKLRWIIGKYSGNFTTFQQQDSQELLAFLLDGLHEDLNRVQHKPYTELKDSEGRPDTLVAQEAWENHILRNKSVIVDLFHGQLKSKVTCKVCGNESARFDPFSYLTLPLPMESYIYLEVIVMKLDGSTPVKYGLRLISDSKYKDLKWHLSAITGIGKHQFMLTELENCQLKLILPDEMKVRGTSKACQVFAYELPSVRSASTSEFKGENGNSKDRQLFSHIQRSTHHSSPCLRNARNYQNSADEKDVDIIMEADQEAGDSLDSALNKGSVGQQKAPSLSEAQVVDDNTEKGFLIAFHRQMIRQEVYFLSSQKSKPSLFGLPLVVSCNSSTTHKDLYSSIWLQVSRLVSPLPPSEAPGLNHAHDCDDSLGYEFPFVLRVVERLGQYCAKCPWHSFCRGCEIPCDGKTFQSTTAYLAVDWDPTALHLRYQSSLEKMFEEHSSVSEMLCKHIEPISLADCLETFCSEETLEYSCDKCKKLQQASKKLQIWRLPPVLIVHLKRFQFCGSKWIKSQKIVDFPLRNFDPTDYLASVPRQTILLHRAELEGMDTATYIANLHEKDNVFLEIVHENQMMERLKWNSLEQKSVKCLPRAINGIISCSPELLVSEPEILDGKRRVRNGSVLYGETLQDFHQHRLEEGHDPLELKYNLYAIACHSGIMEGGHYVCYAKTQQGKWICFNDSSCKEVNESQLDLESSYMLFYERQGLSTEQYMPTIEGKVPFALEDEDQEDIRKQCSVM